VGTTPDEVRAEIEATRAQLEKDLDQLGEKVSPGKVAARTAHDARVAAGRAASAVRDRAEQNPAVASVRRKAHERADHTATAVRGQMDAHPRVVEGAQMAKDSTLRATQAAGRQARRNPRTSAGLLGVVLVALVTLVVVRRHARAPRARSHDDGDGAGGRLRGRLTAGTVRTVFPGGRLLVRSRQDG
jgi:cobalamin biosynthesis Mg chelatase CobN